MKDKTGWINSKAGWITKTGGIADGYDGLVTDGVGGG